MELHKNSNAPECKSHTQAINKHNIIKFIAWADSHDNFLYLVRAPLYTTYHLSNSLNNALEYCAVSLTVFMGTLYLEQRGVLICLGVVKNNDKNKK